MDRFDLYVLAAGTIVIQPYMIYVAGAALVAAVLLLIGKHLVKLRVEKNQQLQAEENQLFPEPWLSVFNECKKMDGYQGRMILFNAWFSLPLQEEELPRLSMGAIYQMAEMIAGSDDDSDFRTIAEKLSPYLAFKNGTPSTRKSPQPITHKDTETPFFGGDGCERHPDVEIINNCHQCGAPQCCPACCNEAMIEAGRCGSHAILGQHAKFDDNCCLCGVPIRQGELQCCSACHKNPRAPVEKIMHTENYVAPACCPMCDCPGNDCDCVAKILADARD